MPSTRDIRRRIKSVKSTAQITKAMQMVASSKMAKAQQAAINGRPFALMASHLLGHVSKESQDYTHPLMEKREVRKRALVVVSTDKGLCGALNANLAREVSKYDVAQTVFVAVGRKAAQYLARTRRKLVGEFNYKDTPVYSECEAISHFVEDLFLKGEVDAVDVLYTRFINTLSQRPEVSPLLPLTDFEWLRKIAQGDKKSEESAPTHSHYDFLFEPDQNTLLR